MYIYGVYLNKKMVFSSTEIEKVYDYIHSVYNKNSLDKFNVHYYGNDYVTHYTNNKDELYIIREKKDFIKKNIINLLKTKINYKTSVDKNIVLKQEKENDRRKPYRDAKQFKIGTIRSGLDNNDYIVEKNDKKIWKLIK